MSRLSAQQNCFMWGIFKVEMVQLEAARQPVASSVPWPHSHSVLSYGQHLGIVHTRTNDFFTWWRAVDFISNKEGLFAVTDVNPGLL